MLKSLNHIFLIRQLNFVDSFDYDVKINFEREGVMSEFALMLNDDWRVSADSLQWMLQKRTSSNGKPVWVSQCYIATNKKYLIRNIKEREIEINEIASKELDQLPETFTDFVSIYHTKSGRGRKPVNLENKI